MTLLNTHWYNLLNEVSNRVSCLIEHLLNLSQFKEHHQFHGDESIVFGSYLPTKHSDKCQTADNCICSHIFNIKIKLVRDDPELGELELAWYLPCLVIRVSAMPHKHMNPENKQIIDQHSELLNDLTTIHQHLV